MDSAERIRLEKVKAWIGNWQGQLSPRVNWDDIKWLVQKVEGLDSKLAELERKIAEWGR